MQRFIGIKEDSGSGPKTRQKSEHDNDNGREADVVLEPLILVFWLMVVDQFVLGYIVFGSAIPIFADHLFSSGTGAGTLRLTSAKFRHAFVEFATSLQLFSRRYGVLHRRSSLRQVVYPALTLVSISLYA